MERGVVRDALLDDGGAVVFQRAAVVGDDQREVVHLRLGRLQELGPAVLERVSLDHELLKVRDRLVLVEGQPVLALVHDAVVVDARRSLDADVLHVAQAHH